MDISRRKIDNEIIDLKAASGSLLIGWFSPISGIMFDGGTIYGGGNYSFQVPFDGDAVLYIHRNIISTDP
jgi:hypothetical protein